MNYESNDNIVTITFDDGKANVVGVQFLEDINAMLDRAEGEQAARLFCAGAMACSLAASIWESLKKARKRAWRW